MKNAIAKSEMMRMRFSRAYFQFHHVSCISGLPARPLHLWPSHASFEKIVFIQTRGKNENVSSFARPFFIEAVFFVFLSKFAYIFLYF
jgi:hypothetical protein